jgi:hypothetical protein
LTFEEFDQFQAKLLGEVTGMSATKGKEYANREQRFANFSRLATRLRISPETVCLIYLAKHMDAIDSYVNTGHEFSEEKIRGRLVDAITYLTLLAGIIEERKKPTVAS